MYIANPKTSTVVLEIKKSKAILLQKIDIREKKHLF